MFSYFANPHRFTRFARIGEPVSAVIAVFGLLTGLYLGLFASPADELQGEAVRILYVHVPAAWCALMAYTMLAVASLISVVWRHPLADSAARAFALPGAAFTALALITGAIWGQTSWGTWWQWDGRMTSVLILFFIYLAYMSLWSLIPDRKRASRLAAIFAMVGFINIPIIKFSVEWWNSLHQPATISNIGAPGLPAEMLLPLLIMMSGYTALFAWLSLRSIRADIVTEQVRRRQSKPIATPHMETL